MWHSKGKQRMIKTLQRVIPWNALACTHKREVLTCSA